MTDRIRIALGDLKARQDSGEHMPCPRCGRNGSACKVCGFDFGIAFGEGFSGKIEVHHIKPISEIGKEYVVDPVHDLVPVCPNCHMMLHSKFDGVYSIEELRHLRAKCM